MIRCLTRARWSRVAAVCGVLVLAAVGPATAGHDPSAAAPGGHRAPETVPGKPGTPQPPTRVFVEDFENRQANLPVRLNAYTGVTGMRYTADQAWLQNCNGWVAAFQDPPGGNAAVQPQVADCTPRPGGPGTPGATAWNRVRQLAQTLGSVNGTADPSANHAVSAYTNGSINDGNPGADKVEFQTVDPVPLPQHGRFLTFSVNAAETSCDANHNHAMLNFFLVNGSTSIPVTNQSIDPCAVGKEVAPGYFGGTFTGDAPLLYTASSVGIKMTNGQGSGNGNDHAFDDIRLLDVTPQLDKSFSPSALEVGETSTLTFTITNTDELLAKDGWSFTDSLPDGLTLASPAHGRTDCPSGTVTAHDGGSEISVAGGSLKARQASCTVTVDVTSSTPGTYTNAGSNITGSTGVNPPGSADVTFVRTEAPEISVEKTAEPSTFSASGQAIHFRYRVTNTGNVSLSRVGVLDRLPGLPGVRCPKETLEPGDSQVCTANYRTTQQDVDRGFVHNVATAHGTPPGSKTPVVSRPSATTVYVQVPVTG